MEIYKVRATVAEQDCLRFIAGCRKELPQIVQEWLDFGNTVYILKNNSYELYYSGNKPNYRG